MLTKGIVNRLELPHEAGAFIEITPLGYRALRRAREVRTLEQIKLFNAAQTGSSDATRQAIQEAVNAAKQELPTPTPEQVAAAEAAREAEQKRKTADLNEYDVPTLLHEGIVGWSYEEKVSPAAIDSLDEVTAEYVAKHLIPQPESAEERKNG